MSQYRNVDFGETGLQKSECVSDAWPTKGLGNPTPTKHHACVYTSRLFVCDEMSTEPRLIDSFAHALVTESQHHVASAFG